MDAFVKVIKNRGHEILINDRATYILIQSEKIEIWFREKLRRIPPSSPNSWQQYEPTGIVTFNAKICYNDVEWKDGQLPLEKQLARIIAKLEIKGAMMRKETLEWEKRRAEQQERERIAMELRMRKETELSNFLDIFQLARQHNEAEFLRTYINEVESHASKTNTLSEDKMKWLEWARKKADWYDPLVSLPDELLDGFDKKNLTLKRGNNSN